RRRAPRASTCARCSTTRCCASGRRRRSRRRRSSRRTSRGSSIATSSRRPPASVRGRRMTDAALAAMQDTIRAAAAAGRPLAIRGGGTKRFYGGAENGDVLETNHVAGIVYYAPTELVITARAGTLLGDIEDAMRKEGQMLAFEPPRFATGGTLGGAVAT